MISVTKVASYICKRYSDEFGQQIDEMKLHKLLYLIQRESLIETDTPILGEVFEAWKYGPVVPEVRYLYKYGLLNETISNEEIMPFQHAIDKAFKLYAHQKSWSLSSITHGEHSWQVAHSVCATGANAKAIISTNDIREDASKIRLRRYMLQQH